MERDKRSIQSILIGFRIVRVLAQSDQPMSLSEIARQVAMTPSKTVMYLASFCSVGLLMRDSALRYRMGPYARELGLAALNGADILTAAREEMRLLRDGDIFAVYLSMWSDQGPVIIRKEDKHPLLPMTIRLGHVLPLLRSAAGRVFLAYLPEDATKTIVERELKLDNSVGARQLKAVVAEIRRNRYAALRGHMNLGMVAKAAPIFDHDRQIVGALTALGPKPPARSRADRESSLRLLGSVQKISAQLGTPATSDLLDT